jgi:hypothetical protein
MLNFINEKLAIQVTSKLDTGEDITTEDEDSWLKVLLIKTGDENKIMQVLMNKKDMSVKVLFDSVVSNLTVAEVLNFVTDSIKKLAPKMIDDLKDACKINEKTNRIHTRVNGEHQVFEVPGNNLARIIQQARSELKTNRVLIQVK